MTIILLFPSDNSLGWADADFYCMDDDRAFKKAWENRKELEAKFYCLDEPMLPSLPFKPWEEFEDDFNEERMSDNNHWMKVLHTNDKFVLEVIKFEKAAKEEDDDRSEMPWDYGKHFD